MSSQIYANIQISLGITAFIFDLFLFCTIVAFRSLNSCFHYNLLKHWCCINGSYLALLTLSQLFLYNISYDATVTSCTLFTIIDVLFFINYLILILIAIEWTCFIYKREVFVKMREKKNCLTVSVYLFTVFAMCFSARSCVVPREENYHVFSLIITVEYFVFFFMLIAITVAHQIKCKLNADFKQYSVFPLKIAYVGFFTWFWQFAVIALNLFDVLEISVYVGYCYGFLGMSTPIFLLIYCLVCDNRFRDCLQYVFGCKAYDELCNSANVEMEVCFRV